VVRVDGRGTKYATAEKRNKTKKKVDERMWILRKENYSDKDIAKKLEEEFGVVYQPKSVASRLPKIQKEKQEEEDQKLDEELSDWHVGEVRSPKFQTEAVLML
jgi:transposase